MLNEPSSTSPDLVIQKKMIPIIAQQHLLKLLRMQVGGNFAPKHCEANQTSIPNLICQIYFSKVAHHATVLSKNEISLPFRRRIRKRLVRRISIQKSFRKSFFLLLSSMIDDVASVKSLNVFNNLLQKPIFFQPASKKVERQVCCRWTRARFEHFFLLLTSIEPFFLQNLFATNKISQPF